MATLTPTLPWTDLLAQEGVEYVERGPNVARDHINIHCPWCGPEDPSHHLGISLQGKGWGCWRNPTHRGRSPKRLLYKLLGDRAAQYLPQPTSMELLDIAQLPSRFQMTLPVEKETATVEDITRWERGFAFTHRLTQSEFDRPFLEYLTVRRQLSPHTALRAGLRVTRYGPLSWRILCPIRWVRELQGWTARAIGQATPRYLVGPGRMDTLNLVRPPFLDAPIVILEGYFDALRLLENSPGRQFGIIALHGTALSTHKVQQLDQLSQRHTLIFALDGDAQHLAVEYSLHWDGWASPPPSGRKDLGEAADGEIRTWIHQLSIN